MKRLSARAAGMALLLSACAATASAQSAAPKSDPRDTNLRAYVELMRSDIRSQKVAILTELMGFDEKEDAAFWPIYREYDVELSALNDHRVKLIVDYSKNFESMTNETADRLARGAIDFETKRAALKLKYFDKVKTALSAKQAARFLQIENQLQYIIDLQIAASLPIVE